MSFGMVEMALVLVVVLMLFGAGKLPQVMGDLAKGVRNFRDGLKDGQEAEGAATPAARSTCRCSSTGPRSGTVWCADLRRI